MKKIAFEERAFVLHQRQDACVLNKLLEISDLVDSNAAENTIVRRFDEMVIHSSVEDRFGPGVDQRSEIWLHGRGVGRNLRGCVDYG